MPASSRGDGTARGPRVRRGGATGGRGGASGRSGSTAARPRRMVAPAHVKSRASRSGLDRRGEVLVTVRAVHQRHKAALCPRPRQVRWSETGYRGSSAGGSGSSYFAARAPAVRAVLTADRALAVRAPGFAVQAPGLASKGAQAPIGVQVHLQIAGRFLKRRPRAFKPTSQRASRGDSPRGGWDRPGPRRDRPAASRRDGPAARPEPEDGAFSDSGPIPSSIGRAATTGRNLWPRPPRAPRSESSRGSRGDLPATRAASGSSRAGRPATPRRSPAGGGYERPSPIGRGGGVGQPLGRGSRAGEPSSVRGSAKIRRELGGDQVEGRQAVRELLSARRRAVHEVWMMEGTDPAAILREIQALARANHVPVRLVSQRQIQQAQGSEAPQGVIAFADALSEADLSELVGKSNMDAQAGTLAQADSIPACAISLKTRSRATPPSRPRAPIAGLLPALAGSSRRSFLSSSTASPTRRT